MLYREWLHLQSMTGLRRLNFLCARITKGKGVVGRDASKNSASRTRRLFSLPLDLLSGKHNSGRSSASLFSIPGVFSFVRLCISHITVRSKHKLSTNVTGTDHGDGTRS